MGSGEVQKPHALHRPGDVLHALSETGCRASAGLPGAAASEDKPALSHKVFSSEKRERGQCERYEGPVVLGFFFPDTYAFFPFLPHSRTRGSTSHGRTPGQHTAFCANTEVNVQPTQERELVQPGDVGGEWSLEPLYSRRPGPGQPGTSRVTCPAHLPLAEWRRGSGCETFWLSFF